MQFKNQVEYAKSFSFHKSWFIAKASQETTYFSILGFWNLNETKQLQQKTTTESESVRLDLMCMNCTGTALY
jgi:hypothetical protein